MSGAMDERTARATTRWRGWPASSQPRRGGDPATSYVARLFAKGEDAVLKKIGEEADRGRHGLQGRRPEARIVAEVADLWFHTLIALGAIGLTPADVLAELERREGLSGLEEFAARKMSSERGRRHMNEIDRRAIRPRSPEPDARSPT